MFRWLMFTALRLLIVCAGIGLLISRQWGWPEYASPELYLASQFWMGGVHVRYFISAADGSGETEELVSKAGAIYALNCSPDGRTLAFLTETAHLYVLNRTGILYDTPIESTYVDLRVIPRYLSVANNGLVAFYQKKAGGILVDAHQSKPLIPPRANWTYDGISVSSQNYELWNLGGGIDVVSPTGERIMTLDYYGGTWTSSEQYVNATYTSPNQAAQYLIDIANQRAVRLNDVTITVQPISPDLSKIAIPRYSDEEGNDVTDVYDLISRNRVVRVTHSGESPLCFITFRPQMLLADNP